MSNILIASIVRNEARHLDRWYTQLKRTVASMPEHAFHLSVYENDSTDDDTAAKLAAYDWSFLHSHVIVHAGLNLPFFVGGKHPQRVALLAYCRNQAIANCPFIIQMDGVVFVEPDIEFTHDAIERIINHEKHYGIKADVFTGKSVHPGTDGIYDSWGTRRTPDQTDWIDGDEDGPRLQPMWSVFNCLVWYNAEPIKKGIMFGGVNPRTGQSDCDTVVIVERFRAAGYDKVYWHKDIKITHFCA